MTDTGIVLCSAGGEVGAPGSIRFRRSGLSQLWINRATFSTTRSEVPIRDSEPTSRLRSTCRAPRESRSAHLITLLPAARTSRSMRAASLVGDHFGTSSRSEGTTSATSACASGCRRFFGSRGRSSGRQQAGSSKLGRQFEGWCSARAWRTLSVFRQKKRSLHLPARHRGG